MGRTRSSSRFPPGTDNPRPGQSISQPWQPARCCPHSCPPVLPSHPHSFSPLPHPPGACSLTASHKSSSCCALTFRKSSWIAPYFTRLPIPEQSWRPVHSPVSLILFFPVSFHSANYLGVLSSPEHPDGKVLASQTGGALVTENTSKLSALTPWRHSRPPDSWHTSNKGNLPGGRTSQSSP